MAWSTSDIGAYKAVEGAGVDGTASLTGTGVVTATGAALEFHTGTATITGAAICTVSESSGRQDVGLCTSVGSVTASGAGLEFHTGAAAVSVTGVVQIANVTTGRFGAVSISSTGSIAASVFALYPNEYLYPTSFVIVPQGLKGVYTDLDESPDTPDSNWLSVA